MGRSTIQVYALVVCFATLMCFVIALGIGLYDMVQIIAPAFTFSGWESYESNEQYVAIWPDKKDLPEQELTRIRQDAYGAAIGAERHRAMQSGVYVFIILVIDAMVYIMHWRIARREGVAGQ